MDLRLVGGVLARFKVLVVGGALLAVLLAVLAYGTPGFSNGKPALTPRAAEVWQGKAELIITGTKASRSQPQGPSATGASTPAEASATDQGYLASLSPIYAALGNGDAVQAEIHRRADVPGTIQAAEVVDAATGNALPFVTLTALAPTQRDAETLVARGGAVVEQYVAAEQRSAESGPVHVSLRVVKSGTPATLVEGHKLTAPLLVFIAVIVAVIALVFVLENLNPRTAAALGRVPVLGESQSNSTGGNGHRPPANGQAGAIADVSRARPATASSVGEKKTLKQP
jgi:hypothetical protein